MKKNKFYLGATAMLLSAVTACNNDEVAPIVPPTDNAITTITPVEDYSTIEEGDTLYYTVTTDKLVRMAIHFSPIFNEGSTADASDIEVISNTLPAYRDSTTVAVVILNDGLVEPNESFSFNIDASEDNAYNFQLHPDSDSEVVAGEITDEYDFTLDFSEGEFQGQDMCDWEVDLDAKIYTMDGETVVNSEAATGDCPLETGTFASLEDGTYQIYVTPYLYRDQETGEILAASGIPAGANYDIPWVLRISNNSGEPYLVPGSFNSDTLTDGGAIAGIVEVANGTYTIYDAEGNVIGTI